jgi:pimeloyl-ACP methyl ester carboxylesterase
MYCSCMTTTPVVLIHGLGSSFEHNWRGGGWIDLLESEGREVIGFELPGHGAQRALVEEPAIERLAALLADRGPADVVGFSAGAVLALATLVRYPSGFRRVALLGIGDSMLDPDDARRRALADRLEADEVEAGDTMTRLLRQMIATAGNDLASVAAYARETARVAPPDTWPRIDAPVLVVLGDDDPVGPADRLVAALPGARSIGLARTDHFATTGSHACLDAVLRFVS